MTDLAAWLLEQIAADEAVARAATAGPWVVKDCGDSTFTSENGKGWWWVWREAALPYYGGVMEPGDGHPPDCNIGSCAITDNHDGDQERLDATHIATFDPARVLAECAAKRTIVKMHSPGVSDRWEGGYYECHFCEGYQYPCPTLFCLAQPYADRPGFDPAWKVET